jgi:hypothetical protein
MRLCSVEDSAHHQLTQQVAFFLAEKPLRLGSHESLGADRRNRYRRAPCVSLNFYRNDGVSFVVGTQSFPTHHGPRISASRKEGRKNRISLDVYRENSHVPQ